MVNGRAGMSLHADRVIWSHELARHIGVPATELREIAYRRQLPFLVSNSGGFGIGRQDLSTWLAATRQNCVGCEP
jgi:hypothetical protein